MCGIFAYSGSRPAADILIEGLKKLEYRGYDSSGVAFFHGGRVKRLRAAGAVSKLESLLKEDLQADKFLEESAAEGAGSHKAAGGGGDSPPFHLGIGHTRWATHGPPSEQNAHPHKASSVYVVHNGVIENEEDLKKIIQPEGLASETDTELIACLISRFYKENNDFFQSALNAMDLLKGSYAVAAICEDSPFDLAAFKKGPPLMLCRGQGEFFISSDPHVAGRCAEELLFLEDGDILCLRKNRFKIFNAGERGRPSLVAEGAADGSLLSGESGPQNSWRAWELSEPPAKSLEKAKPRPSKTASPPAKRKFVRWSASERLSEKRGYPHFMLKEIFEQPFAASRLIGAHIDKSKRDLRFQIAKGDPAAFDSLLKNHSRVLIIACGSSYHAALFAKYIMEEMAPVHVDVEVASEFIYRSFILPREGPALFISQSGETADILRALDQVKKRGARAISLCNVQGSSLDRRADYGLDMAAGHEAGVASTKTFSSTLILLSLLSLHIAQLKNGMKKQAKSGAKGDLKGARGEKQRESRNPKGQSAGESEKMIDSLLSLPSFMEEVLGYDRFFLNHVEQLKKFSGFFFLGRGGYYPIALEGALKLKEISYLHAEGYPAGEMKHGPLAMIDEKMMAVVLFPFSQTLYEKAMTNLKEAKARGAALMAIGGAKDSELKNLCGYHLPLPKIHERLHPVLALIPLQLMAYFISRSYGYNADRPRNLAKSVTVE